MLLCKQCLTRSARGGRQKLLRLYAQGLSLNHRSWFSGEWDQSGGNVCLLALKCGLGSPLESRLFFALILPAPLNPLALVLRLRENLECYLTGASFSPGGLAFQFYLLLSSFSPFFLLSPLQLYSTIENLKSYFIPNLKDNQSLSN
jgi:hypothetical protein